MRVVLINPPLIEAPENLGSATTIPLGITYLAGFLRGKGVNVSIIDSFGEKPSQVKKFKKRYVSVGLTPSEVAARIPEDSGLIGITVMTAIAHNVTLEIIKEIRKLYPDKAIVIGGNHATFRHRDFLRKEADYVILGEGETALYQLTKVVKKELNPFSIDGIAFMKDGGVRVNPKKKFIEDIDSLPYPARDMLPLENYWKFKQGQGPVDGKFTTIISARGCPFCCTFCTSPLFWQKKWRPRSAKKVVDEIEYCVKKYGITDFHFSDDGLTTLKDRTIEICKGIVDRKLNITWNLPNGLRADTVDDETLVWMKRAGCTFFQIAPESGSERMLKLMKKPIKLNHMLKVINKANKLGILTGAFFVVGYPGERWRDLLKTYKYVMKLMWNGMDEFAMCTLTPLPGNTIGPRYILPDGFEDWEKLWVSSGGNHKHARRLHLFKIFTYASFYAGQFFCHPSKPFRVIADTIRLRQHTKVNMVLNRKIRFLKNLLIKGAQQ